MFPNLTPVVKNLLIINIIFFLGSSVVGASYDYLSAFYPDSPYFKVWQVITYMFMHGGFTHIFFNMFSLLMFGPMIEQVLGAKRFINFYLFTGLGALVLQYGVQAFELYQMVGTSFPLRQGIDLGSLTGSQLGFVQEINGTRLVGASGAIYGILLAFAYLFPNIPLQLIFIPIPIKAKYFIGGLIAIEIYSSLSQPGDSVAHLAHVGGALFGYILLKMWGIRKGLY
ncbi:rhomboid family intramembrane serine protease [Sphingobacterium sp. SYP-B4668]|uniref:rhomboid family intramembrane serine protease n=1 Tax=Sphingobacterium sp. SYP-B4668 TaxID=2996035 RepID=UPI0005323626|nr:rhomboid family intramembrane serine protease [Sphingobacterium sp. SYP-B4668]